VEGSGAAIETAETDTLPAPALVTAHRLDVNGCEGPDVMLTIECSAGFYVRALAHDLGERLGTGAHLCALRRTRSGDITLDHAVALDAIERDPSLASRALIPLSRMLPGMPSAQLTPDGVRRAAQGRNIGSMDLSAGGVSMDAPWIRLVGPAGDLVAIAEPSGVSGFLHPSVVLV
jgi:tRNA pseudouridine55 synthase